MKDKGIVIKTENNLADVKVECLSICNECGAHSLCIGKKESQGILKVKNPLQAKTGDRVDINVPEEKYSRALILLFGMLLAMSLGGIGAGYMCSFLFSLPAALMSLSGLALGLGLAVLFLLCRFKRMDYLYPVITGIISYGGSHE